MSSASSLPPSPIVSGGYNALHFLWVFYCNELALPNTPLHVLECYHANLVSLPWQLYTPDIPAMDLMIKVIRRNVGRRERENVHVY